jgi:hypothetical protein
VIENVLLGINHGGLTATHGSTIFNFELQSSLSKGLDMIDAELKRIERSTYRAAADSGLWDLFLATILAMFAIAPVLSVYLGDFWSSAVFVPVFAVVLLTIRVVNTRIIRPRIGVVEFARSRRRRIVVLTSVMVIVNIVALIAGVVVAFREPTLQGPIVPVSLSLVVLTGFSFAAFMLEIPRVFFYGVLLAAAPPIGEFLFSRGYASHHGFPVVFGTCALIIFASGIIRFIGFLPRRPAATGPSNED